MFVVPRGDSFVVAGVPTAAAGVRYRSRQLDELWRSGSQSHATNLSFFLLGHHLYQHN